MLHSTQNQTNIFTFYKPNPNQTTTTTQTKLHPFFHTYSSENKFIWLMSQEDAKIVKLAASFIKTSMEERIH